MSEKMKAALLQMRDALRVDDPHGHYDLVCEALAEQPALSVPDGSTIAPIQTTYLTRGYDDLWSWFSLDRASWLTLPRVLMHEMPDEWQQKMAALLSDWDRAWSTDHLPSPVVSAKEGARFTRWPQWLLNYRRPDRAQIESIRTPTPDARSQPLTPARKCRND